MTIRDILKISELSCYAGTHSSIDVYTLDGMIILGVQNGHYKIPEKYCDYEISKIKVGNNLHILIDIPETEVEDFNFYDKKNIIDG